MEKRKGKCINFGLCDKAENREVIEVAADQEFVCSDPACGKPLQPLAGPPSPSPWHKVALAVLRLPPRVRQPVKA